MLNMEQTSTFLFSGILLGLSGGIMPGPLLTLVISETLWHGAKEGVKVALSPLITDLPIVLVAVYILHRLAAIDTALGAISLCGAALLVYFAYGSLTFKGADVDIPSERPQSLKKGVLANFLNPSPYVFWLSIGAPTVLKASRQNVFSAAAFIGGFYLLLVGSKIIVALLVGRSRLFLKSGHYINSIRLLGLLLIGFAIIFVKDGLTYLGLWL